MNTVCTWHGRHEYKVKVTGANDVTEAREAALIFAQCPEDITLDEGSLMDWPYDEPKPADWQDYYVFSCEDVDQSDTREWWE